MSETPSKEALAAARAEVQHWRAAAESVGESDGHGWALTTDNLRTRIAALEQERDQLQLQINEGYKSIANMAGVMRELKKKVLDTQQQNDALRKALEFYADRKNWISMFDAEGDEIEDVAPVTHPDGYGGPVTMFDTGDIARAALKEPTT